MLGDLLQGEDVEENTDDEGADDEAKRSKGLDGGLLARSSSQLPSKD